MIDIVDINLYRPQFAGSYIISSNNEYGIVELGTAHGVPILLNYFKENNIALEKIKYIFVTHIHLDHSSGVGKLIQCLPMAKVIVHPNGAKHLIDPKNIIMGANAVYGEEVVRRDYGDVLPINSNRVIECSHKEVFKIGDINLTTLFTPGHARHHIAIFEDFNNGMFTGDSLGLSYPELTTKKGRFVQPTTTPTAFEYDKMKESIELIKTFNPQKIYMTHFGILDDVKSVYQQVEKRLEDYIDLVKKDSSLSGLKKLLRNYYLDEAINHGVNLGKKELEEVFYVDIELHAQGLALWAEKEKSKKT